MDSDFWTYLFKRPGNFRGRGIALLHTGGMRKACTLFSGLNLRAEQNRLRNLYLRFKAQNFDAARIDEVYASDREQFRIPGSDDSFAWDRSRQALLRPGRGELPTYVLPYR